MLVDSGPHRSRAAVQPASSILLRYTADALGRLVRMAVQQPAGERGPKQAALGSFSLDDLPQMDNTSVHAFRRFAISRHARRSQRDMLATWRRQFWATRRCREPAARHVGGRGALSPEKRSRDAPGAPVLPKQQGDKRRLIGLPR